MHMKKADNNKRTVKIKDRGISKALIWMFILAIVVPVAITGLAIFLIYKSVNYAPDYLVTYGVPAAAGLLGGVICLSICGGYYKKRCNDVGKAMNDMIEGSYTRNSTVYNDKAERGVVDGINNVADALYTLRDQNAHFSEKSELLKDECDSLRFSLLTAKSSPSLLVRALEKINGLAANGKTQELEELTGILTEIIKKSMIDSHTLVPLARELELIKGYLEANDAVSGQKTDYRMSIMCNIVNYKIIPHIIFPIVESFFEFANRDGVSQYEIGVEVTSSPKNMLIIIRDNGAGLSQSNLEQIQKELEEDIVDVNRSAISLPNINRRIKLYYGDLYGLKLSSSKLGTIVRIYLPAKGNDF